MLDLYIPSKPQKHRTQKVADLIRSVLAEILVRGDVPPLTDQKTGELLTLPVPVTLTHVKLSPDLKSASIYVMPLGGLKQKETLAYLSRAHGYLRHCVGKKVHLRTAPALTFYIDPTFENVKRVENILTKIVKPEEDNT